MNTWMERSVPQDGDDVESMLAQDPQAAAACWSA